MRAESWEAGGWELGVGLGVLVSWWFRVKMAATVGKVIVPEEARCENPATFPSRPEIKQRKGAPDQEYSATHRGSRITPRSCN